VELTRVFLAAFEISDVLGNEVENAQIFVEDELIEGFELDDLDNGTYAFRIEAEGYAAYEDSFEINDDDLILNITLTPVYTALFSIWDPWGYPVDHAVITIGGQILEPGDYQVEHLISGTHEFSISATSFFDYEGSFEIDFDHVEVDIILSPDGTSLTEAGLDALKIYPNPAQSVVTLEFTAMQNMEYQISLVNHLGQTVQYLKKVSQPGNTKLEMNVSDLKSGIYFIRIDNGSEVLNYKLIVR
jgi:hypothetical protein